MTVKELIEKLQTQDWDDLTEVRTPGRYDSLYGLNPGDKAVILE